MLVNRPGVVRMPVNGLVWNVAGSMVTALVMEPLSTMLRWASRVNDDFLVSGPPALPSNSFSRKGALSGAYGLRVFQKSLAKFHCAVPRYLSAPGLVKISILPYPSLSYSGENGFWLMRISRIDSFGGSCPPLKPSTKMDPPLGPAEGPARAERSAARSSGSSESASRSAPRRTMAPALLEESVLSACPAVFCTVSFSEIDATFNTRFSDCEPVRSVTLTGWTCANSGADACTMYSPGATPLNV